MTNRELLLGFIALCVGINFVLVTDYLRAQDGFMTVLTASLMLFGIYLFFTI